MGNVEDLSSQEWSTAFIFHHSPYHPFMVYLITYIYHKKWPNVGKYTSPMDGMVTTWSSAILASGESLAAQRGVPP